MPSKDKDVPYIIFDVKYTGRYNVQCTVPYLEPDPEKMDADPQPCRYWIVQIRGYGTVKKIFF